MIPELRRALLLAALGLAGGGRRGSGARALLDDLDGRLAGDAGGPLGEAFLERVHQVDDLAARRFGGGKGDLLALDLLVHHLEHALAVFVLVLVRLELVRRQLVDELARELTLAL